MNLEDNPSTRIAWKLRDLHHQHMHEIQHVLENHQLHFGQPRILHTILCLKSATQKEIAEAMNVSPASLSMSIKRMEKAGLLSKTRSQDDLRSNRIEVTESGRKIDETTKSAMITIDDRMLTGFTESELEQLTGYLNRMIDNFRHPGEE